MPFFINCKSCTKETGNPGMSDVAWGVRSICEFGMSTSESKFYCSHYSSESGINLYNAGNAAYRQGKHEKAIALYLRSIKVNRRDWAAHHNLALVYNAIKNHSKALHHINIAQDIRPSADVTQTKKCILDTTTETIVKHRAIEYS